MSRSSSKTAEFGILPVYVLAPYFRLFAMPALQGGIGLAGLAYLAAHRSASGAAIFAVALVSSYAARNGLLFWESFRMKRRVAQVFAEYPGLGLERIPPAVVTRYFDPEALVPSYFRPKSLMEHFERSGVQVYLAKSGTTAEMFTSSLAFVSPLGLNSYIFLRDDPAEPSPVGLFRMAHEIGHAAAIYATKAQSEAIGMMCVYASVVWLAIGSSWSPFFLGWTAIQLILAIVMRRGARAQFKAQDRFDAEVAADYTALRNMPPDAIRALIGGYEPGELIGHDRALTEEQTSMRRAILAGYFAQLRRDEDIDIPAYYMQQMFRQPLALVCFVFAHFAYVCCFAAMSVITIGTALLGMTPLLLYFLLGVYADALAGAAAGEKLTPPA